MKFYKFAIKVIRGDAELEVEVFQMGMSQEHAIRLIQKMQIWKKAEHEILAYEEIDELDYIVGLIKNPYYWLGDTSANKFRDLNWIVKKRHYTNGAFETEDGNKLMAFCNNYRMVKKCFANNPETRENNQKIIEREYINWAEDLIYEYNAQKLVGD